MALKLQDADKAWSTSRKTMAQAIGDQARLHRNQAGISIRKMAKSLDVSPTTIVKLENGEIPWSESRCSKYANTLKNDIL